jgi:hypothetical protein
MVLFAQAVFFSPAAIAAAPHLIATPATERRS